MLSFSVYARRLLSSFSMRDKRAIQNNSIKLFPFIYCNFCYICFGLMVNSFFLVTHSLIFQLCGMISSSECYTKYRETENRSLCCIPILLLYKYIQDSVSYSFFYIIWLVQANSNSATKLALTNLCVMYLILNKFSSICPSRF